MTARPRAGNSRLALPADTALPAPRSGVPLGLAHGGPLALRLFRAAGTRVVVAGDPLPAQLLALRAAAAGTPVHVITRVPELWEAVVAHGAQSRVQRPEEVAPARSGPVLLIDERVDRSRTEVRPWQCRVEIRSDWTASDVGLFSSADVTAFGAVSSEISLRVAALYGLAPRATEAMTTLGPRSAALVRRGRVEYVEVQLSAAEAQLLERAGRQLTASRMAP